MFQLVLEHLEDGPKHILDMGCGSGALLQRIADHYRERGWQPEKYLLGVDLDEKSFQADVPFQSTDLAKPLNLQVRSFDLVIAMEVLEHIRPAYLLLDGNICDFKARRNTVVLGAKHDDHKQSSQFSFHRPIPAL